MNILFVSLGCDKNLVDSEVMLGLLRNSGHTLTNDEQMAEVIVINTCSFIHDAKEESITTILEMAELKKEGSCQILIVTGCLAQRYQTEILNEINEVDAILGTSSYHRIIEVIDEVKAGRKSVHFDSIDDLPKVDVSRVITTGGYSSYLKIAEGCDKHCTYCIIPKIRGDYRSFPKEVLLRDARRLAKAGVKELNVVAQDTTMYGVDLYGKKVFHELLKDLCQIEGIRWIRILYCYPEEITDELIDVIKNEPKICHYLDIPIQHASDKILKSMGRRTSRDELVSMIKKLRREIPDIALRTTLITGFPGETQKEHEELISFIQENRFDRLGVFTYSQEEDTPAATMKEQIDEAVKTSRKNELMLEQQKISFELAMNMTGKVVEVLIEGKLPKDNVYVGRTYKDAHEVDGYIFIHDDKELCSGDILHAKITGANEYDLIGEMIDEFTE